MSLQHEIIHGHPTRKRWLNNLIGQWPLALWLPFENYRHSHLAHHNDEVLLDAFQAGVLSGLRRGGASQTKGGVEFIHRSISFHARVALGDAAIVHQAGKTFVSCFRGNAHAD